MEWDTIFTKLSSKNISQFDNNMAYFVDRPWDYRVSREFSFI